MFETVLLTASTWLQIIPGLYFSNFFEKVMYSSRLRKNLCLQALGDFCIKKSVIRRCDQLVQRFFNYFYL